VPCLPTWPLDALLRACSSSASIPIFVGARQLAAARMYLNS